MNKDFLSHYGEIDAKKDICVEYTGHISQIMIHEMLLSLEIEANLRKINLSILNKISTAFIEIAQNILKYSKKPGRINQDCLHKILVFNNNGKCYLVSRNVIGNSSKEKITSRINQIQSYDRSQINEKYFELCKSGETSHSRGGGVGLYQIARKSDDIQYVIDKISDNRYHLNIMVTININININ